MGHRDLDEDEGDAPDQREGEQDAPFAAVHDAVDHRLGIASARRRRVLRLAVKQFSLSVAMATLLLPYDR